MDSTAHLTQSLTSDTTTTPTFTKLSTCLLDCTTFIQTVSPDLDNGTANISVDISIYSGGYTLDRSHIHADIGFQ